MLFKSIVKICQTLICMTYNRMVRVQLPPNYRNSCKRVATAEYWYGGTQPVVEIYSDKGTRLPKFQWNSCYPCNQHGSRLEDNGIVSNVVGACD